MELAHRDKLFIEIKNKIQCKQNALLDRFETIKTASSDNKLLEGVLQDYVKHYQDTLDTQKQQEKALLILRDYLENISNTLEQSNEKMEYLKNERSQIINKLQDVRLKMEKLNDRTKMTLKNPVVSD